MDARFGRCAFEVYSEADRRQALAKAKASLARQRNNWEAEEDARLFAEGQREDWEREGR